MAKSRDKGRDGKKPKGRFGKGQHQGQPMKKDKSGAGTPANC